MSAQLEHSKVSRQNTTLFVSLYNVTLSLPFRFISVSALPPLSFVASVSCIVNGQSLSGSSVTASRPHHDHLVIEFASAVIPNISTVVCAVGVQFAGGSASKTVGITTDVETPSRGLSNTTVDACSAVVPSISGMSAVVTVDLPAPGQQASKLSFAISGLQAAASIRFISITRLPALSAPSSVACTINGVALAPVPSLSGSGALLLQLAADTAPNSSAVVCALSVLFNAAGLVSCLDSVDGDIVYITPPLFNPLQDPPPNLFFFPHSPALRPSQTPQLTKVLRNFHQCPGKSPLPVLIVLLLPHSAAQRSPKCSYLTEPFPPNSALSGSVSGSSIITSAATILTLQASRHPTLPLQNPPAARPHSLPAELMVSLSWALVPAVQCRCV